MLLEYLDYHIASSDNKMCKQPPFSTRHRHEPQRPNGQGQEFTEPNNEVKKPVISAGIRNKSPFLNGDHNEKNQEKTYLFEAIEKSSEVVIYPRDKMK